MINVQTIHKATGTGAGKWVYLGGLDMQAKGDYQLAPLRFQATAEAASGTVTATVNIEVSNDGVNACSSWVAQITLNATTPASDGAAPMITWPYVRANVTAVSAATTVTVTMGK